MGDLDPAKVKAAVAHSLRMLEPRAVAAKNEKVTQAWNGLAGQFTPALLRGAITVDEWQGALGNFGSALVSVTTPAAQVEVVDDVNKAGQLVEEAFTPPSSMTWLVFAGLAATGVAYWWYRKQEKEKAKAATPEIVFGTRRKVNIPTTEPEEEIEAEFEEI